MFLFIFYNIISLQRSPAFPDENKKLKLQYIKDHKKKKTKRFDLYHFDGKVRIREYWQIYFGPFRTNWAEFTLHNY